jgi:tetratricopeptide (TPR) repeat protein
MIRDAGLVRQGYALAPRLFYLAQSCRDAGLLEEAIGHYLHRAAMGGWEEETWFALFESARLMEYQGRPEGTVAQAYLKVYQARPTRAESLYRLARYFRLRDDFHVARLFAAQAMAIPRPDDWFFLDEACYQWRCLDEYAVASYWTGHMRESMEACERLLAESPLPPADRTRVEANLRWAREALAARTSTLISTAS